MSILAGKKIILGITGGIAAYKTPWLIRDWKKNGAEVQVIVTQSAKEFVTAMTLATLSQRPVISELWPPKDVDRVQASTEHIELGLWADLMLIAPATANTIAKLANGIADNALTTIALATRSPLAVAPAMDVDMYRHDTTQRNIAILRERGVHVLDPESGPLASGLEGPGRLPELETITKFVEGIFLHSQLDLSGKKILVTAGPTYEPIDPVRFIGNRSSGKMGFALANAAAQLGAEVTLIAGPVSLQTPRHVTRINIETAREMLNAVLPIASSQDAIIMAAAIADYTLPAPFDHKIKKHEVQGDEFRLTLKKTDDILAAIGKSKGKTILVGFALETHDNIKYAQEKLVAKNLDFIVINNSGVQGAGFGVDTNIVSILHKNGSLEKFEKMQKYDVALHILDHIVTLIKKQ